MKKDYENVNDFIEDVHNEIDISELIIDMGIVKEKDFRGQFISCIFHDGDDTPSLQIGEHFFRCYSCGAKGDVIKFIQLYFNIDFIEACLKLADILNVNIATVRYNYNKKYEKLQSEWEEYLKNMEEAPKEIKQLQRDYFPQEIGYDKKINYLVLPITSKTGAILGFTKRRVNDEQEFIEYDRGRKVKRPKWKHSSIKDSLIAQVHNIYNFSVASPEIVKTKKVNVTEGPKDVIAYRRIGKNNTICCCGTSNSDNIWDIILPVDEINLSMDLDDAGIHATIITTQYLSSFYNIQQINSIILPENMDPYDVITNENGNEKLEECYSNKVPVIEFIIQYGEASDIYEIYNSVQEYNKIYVLKNVCKFKAFSTDEALSWIQSGANKNNHVKEKKEKDDNDSRQEEIDRLNRIINGENDYEYKGLDNDPVKAIKKAKRILNLKYGGIV